MRLFEGKLHDRRGETLVEVLAAVLICALSVLFLSSMAMTSIRINENAQDHDDGYYDALNFAESRGTALDSDGNPAGETKPGTVTVTVKDLPAGGIATPAPLSLNITYYGGKDVYSFAAP